MVHGDNLMVIEGSRRGPANWDPAFGRDIGVVNFVRCPAAVVSSGQPDSSKFPIWVGLETMQVLAPGLEVGSTRTVEGARVPTLIPGTNSVDRAVPETSVDVYLD